MTNPLIRKLENFVPLGGRDRDALEEACRRPIHLGPREDLIQAGDEPHSVKVILDGWVCRYKQLEDGRRQIVSLLLPGDMCDPYVFLLDVMDQSLASLTPTTYAKIPSETMRAMATASPDLNDALWWDTMVTTDVQREWTVSLGRRSATERLAHLFCELAVRLRAVGLTNGHDYDLPITQTDLGDAMGLSSVHVNRTLQELRGSGLVSLRGRRLTIHDEEGLRALAMFEPGYLHMVPRDVLRPPR